MAFRKRKSSPDSKAAPSGLVNLDEVRALMDLVTEKGFTELEVERDGVRIKIGRHMVAQGVSQQSAPQAAVEAHPPAASRGAAKAPEAGEELFVVRSPMVGTYFAAPGPGADAFVRVGDKVQAGQALCIIEAMKLMNEIESEIAGEVVKCYVENGQPVEYGEPLFDLRPAKR